MSVLSLMSGSSLSSLPQTLLTHTSRGVVLSLHKKYPLPGGARDGREPYLATKGDRLASF